VAGRIVPTLLQLEDMAEVMAPMPARCDLGPAGQLRVEVAGKVLVVTPRRLAVVPQAEGDRWAGATQRPTLWLPDAPVRVLPYPASTAAEQKALSSRAALLDMPLTSMAPSAVLFALNGAMTASPKAQHRRLRETAPQAFDPIYAPTGEECGKVLVVTLSHGHQLLLNSTDELRQQAAGGEPINMDAVAASVMKQAARHLDEGPLRMFLTLCHLRDTAGRVTTDYKTLAMLRGADPLTLDDGAGRKKRRGDKEVDRTPTLRARLHRDLETLLQYTWRVSWMLTAKRGKYLEGPLVTRQLAGGEETASGKRKETHVQLQLNPAIFDPLAAAGLLTAVDRRLLCMSPLAMRIGAYVAGRLALSFVVQRKDLSHGKLEVRVQTLLEAVGADWGEVVAKRGKGPARVWLQGLLGELQDAQHGGPVNWAEHVPGDRPDDDCVRFHQGAHLLERQRLSRTKALDAKTRADTNTRTHAHTSTGTLPGGTT
jgi:hypothetical protein